MDEQTYRAEAATDGFKEPVVVEWEAGHSLDEHVHDFDARLFVLHGEISAALPEKTVTCGPGDVFNYVAGTPHSESAGSDGAKFLSARK